MKDNTTNVVDVKNVYMMKVQNEAEQRKEKRNMLLLLIGLLMTVIVIIVVVPSIKMPGVHAGTPFLSNDTYYSMDSVEYDQILVFNGTNITDITEIRVGETIINASDCNVTVSSCKIQRTRNDTCRITINQRLGIQILQTAPPCEPDMYAAQLNCFDDASRKTLVYMETIHHVT